MAPAARSIAQSLSVIRSRNQLSDSACSEAQIDADVGQEIGFTLVLVISQMEFPLLNCSRGGKAMGYLPSQQSLESGNVLDLEEKKMLGKLLQPDQHISLNLVHVDF